MYVSGYEMNDAAKKDAQDKANGVQKFVSKLAMKKREEKRRKAARRAS